MKSFDAKGNKNKGFFKTYLLLRYPNFFKNDAILPSSFTDIFILSCSKETVKPTELKFILQELLFYVE